MFLIAFSQFKDKVKEEWDVFNKFLNPRKQSLRMYIKIILLYIMIPAACIGAALFYLVCAKLFDNLGVDLLDFT
jgi:hypothetical protein